MEVSNEVISKFKELVKSSIPQVLDRSGTVLYSNYYTLKQGKLYILGFNPGGDPEDRELKFQTIIKDIESERKLDREYNEYFIKWGNYKPGEDPLQRSIRFLVEEVFGLNLREVCASNLIFLRSRKQDGIQNWEELADKCWKVHEFLIREVVKPEIIISFGLQTFSYLLRRLGYNIGFFFPAFWGNWTIKVAMNVYYFGRNLLIFGFPHISRYKIFSLGDREKKMIKDRIFDILKYSELRYGNAK